MEANRYHRSLGAGIGRTDRIYIFSVIYCIAGNQDLFLCAVSVTRTGTTV